MTRKRKTLRQRPPVVPRVENPDAVAAWAYLEPPDAFDAIRLRGGPVFDLIAQMGIRVQRISGADAMSGATGPSVDLAIHWPWTNVFMPVQSADLSSFLDGLPWWCSVIMDCHFPIMDMENAIGADDALIAIIDQKDQIMANLALAEAVTVPSKTWAADLAEVNPNTFYLPDVKTDGTEFVIKLMEIANTARATKMARVRARRDLTGE